MRSRIFRLLVSPIAVIFWMIGWTMLWAGANREKEAKQTRLDGTECRSFIPRPVFLGQPAKIEASIGQNPRLKERIELAQRER